MHIMVQLCRDCKGIVSLTVVIVGGDRLFFLGCVKSHP